MSYDLNFFIASILLRNIINIAANALNFKMTFVIFRNYYFRIIIKKQRNAIIANTFMLKNYKKFAGHNQKNVSSVPGLGLERVCPRKVDSWPWLRIFLSHWPRK